MEVILLEKMRKLGGLGDKVTVKSGYARNYLLPEAKAILATKPNIEHFEKQRADLEKKEAANLAEASARATALEQTSLLITAIASEEGRLYGSIGIAEIKEAFAEQAMNVKKREIALPQGPIHAVGEHVVHVQVHSDLVAVVQVQVVAAKKTTK